VGKQKEDSLEEIRSQVKAFIERNYKTVEEFCWDKDLNKATVSNFLRAKKDFQVSTLQSLAEAVGADLIIRLKFER
jgi:hypothetical protein